MNKTPNYQLNQWDKSDRIQMEDFNADNAKIESALSGIPKIAIGTYTGKGTYGSSNKNSLTFDFTPTIIIITANSASSSGGGTVLVAGQTASSGVSAHYSSYSLELTVSWNNNTVTWYSSRDSVRQLNLSNTTYHYFALGV